MEQQNLTPTPASAWKGKVEVEGTDLPLPSGNVARIRQIAPTAFISSGLIPDPLSHIVRQAINTKKGLNPNQMKKIAEDPDKLVAALELFDRVLAFVAVEPQISMPPTCIHNLGEDGAEPCGTYHNAEDKRHTDPDVKNYHQYREGPRDPEVLYADQVDWNDKVFIFQWCLGGTRDLEKFRSELDASMGTVSDGQDVPRKAKRSGRR